MIEYHNTGNRSEGNTYRMLLACIAKCCSRDGQSVIALFGSRPALNHALQMAAPMTAPLGIFAFVKYSQSSVNFDNGSRIFGVVAGEDFRQRMAGLRFVDAAIDGSAERLDPILMDWLKAAIRPN